MSRNYKFYIPLFDRGFTGHVKQPFGLRISANQLRMLIPQRNECGKMLDVFGLINMLSNAKSRSEALAGNGRMYDPVLGRMLSPDNYVSLPEHTQGYNRYTYALNNPLIITDPSGDNPVLLFIAFAGVLNGAMSAQNGDGFLQGFAKGTATAALSYGVGTAVGPLVSGGKIWADMANAGINTTIAGGITYGADALVNNTAFNWKAYGLNIATSMAFAGLSYQKSSTDEYVTGQYVSDKYRIEYDNRAKRYNKNDTRDDLLKIRLKSQRLKPQGRVKVTSTVPESHGLTPDGKYVQWQGNARYGKVIYGTYINANKTIYISPYICNADIKVFSEVYTHEFIHYFQWQKYGNVIQSADREYEAHLFNRDYFLSHKMIADYNLELKYIETHPFVTGGFKADPGQYSKEIQYLMNGGL